MSNPTRRVEVSVTHFTDERINEITVLGRSLTKDEREFLASNTPSFEECDCTEAELRELPDRQLMQVCYAVWADYARSQS